MTYDENVFKEKANRKARKIWIVFAVLLSANYGSDTSGGLYPTTSYLIFLALCWLPLIFGEVLLRVKGWATELYLEVGDDVDVIDGVVIQGIRHGDHENVEVIFFVGEGEYLVLLQDVDRYQIQYFLVHIDALEIDHIQIQLAAQCLRQIILRYDAFIYQEFSQLLALTIGVVQCLLQLLRRDHPTVYQQFT